MISCGQRLVSFTFICALLFFHSCSKKKSDARTHSSVRNPLETPGHYFTKSEEFVLTVAYEPGAEPYTGTSVQGFSLWNLAEENLFALLEKKAIRPIIKIPKQREEFVLIETQNKNEWKIDDLLALEQKVRRDFPTEKTAHFFVLFLKGKFHNGDSLSPHTIGLSIGGTSLLVIFKETVLSFAQGEQDMVARYAEQSTLIHEWGHALGLVNNGVSAISDHHDHENGHHCKNPDCVMYWLNEGSRDLMTFLQQVIRKKNVILFDKACLEDAHAFSQ
jgi:hypothetical protein